MLKHFTANEVAEQLRVTVDKITDLIHNGQLVAVNVAARVGKKARWRISEAAVEQFLLARQSTAVAPEPAKRRRRPAASGVTNFY